MIKLVQQCFMATCCTFVGSAKGPEGITTVGMSENRTLELIMNSYFKPIATATIKQAYNRIMLRWQDIKSQRRLDWKSIPEVYLITSIFPVEPYYLWSGENRLSNWP